MRYVQFEFVDELPAAIRTNSDQQCERWLIDRFSAVLRNRPGDWAKWPADIRASTAKSYGVQIRSGTMRSFRNGGYEAQVRNGVLYIRYVGEVVSDGRA